MNGVAVSAKKDYTHFFLKLIFIEILILKCCFPFFFLFLFFSKNIFLMNEVVVSAKNIIEC